MTIFELFLAILITAFLILFVVSLIAAYSNYKSIKRLYKLVSILREREEKDFKAISDMAKIIGGGKNGKP